MPTAVSLELGAPLPISLGDCADALAEIRALRLELEHKAEAVKKREDEIQEHIIASIEATPGTTGVVGLRYKAQIKEVRTPVIDDWNSFTAWVIKTGQTQVLYKRVNAKAVAEMEEAKQPIPDGVGMKVDKKLSLTKA
jgi:hypothetical protein